MTKISSNLNMLDKMVKNAEGVSEIGSSESTNIELNLEKNSKVDISK